MAADADFALFHPVYYWGYPDAGLRAKWLLEAGEPLRGERVCRILYHRRHSVPHAGQGRGPLFLTRLQPAGKWAGSPSRLRTRVWHAWPRCTGPCSEGRSRINRARVKPPCLSSCWRLARWARTSPSFCSILTRADPAPRWRVTWKLCTRSHRTRTMTDSKAEWLSGWVAEWFWLILVWMSACVNECDLRWVKRMSAEFN